MALEKWTIHPGEARTIDVEIVRKLRVGLLGGSVNVIAHDEPGTRVEVSAVTGRDLRVEIDGDTLEIDHPQLRWDNWIESAKGLRSNAKAEISILAPRHVAVKLGVVSADAFVSGFEADARLKTITGDLTLDRHSGDVDVNSVNGEVSVSHLTGRLRASTVSGDLVASGEITSFTGSSVSGDMLLDTEGPIKRIDANTIGGEFTARIDEQPGERYRANSVSGRLTIAGETVRSLMGRGVDRTIGRLDGLIADIRANSVSGDISVIRRAASESTSTSTSESAAVSASNANTDAGAGEEVGA